MVKLLLTTALLFLSLISNANNIRVSAVSLRNQDTLNGTTQIKFDLSWENSWRISSAPNNWDAAWIFVKYRVVGKSSEWRHVKLNQTGHLAPDGSVIDLGLLNPGSSYDLSANPAIGAFVYRSTAESGNFSLDGVELQWNYAANNVKNSDQIELKVFAVEMVYVPRGAFSLGDGATQDSSGQFYNAATKIPFRLTSENTLTLGGTSNTNLSKNNGSRIQAATDDFGSTKTQTLDAAFPKGFNAFYCMKYEITQQQWVDFFNCLDSTQRLIRDITGGSVNISGKGADTLINRNNIYWASGDAYLVDQNYGEVACNFLNWMDVAAYLDWSGLRPMTELEFEKSCRGIANPIAYEYAWGNILFANSLYALENQGTPGEFISANYSTTKGNVNWLITNGTTAGPFRVGIFAISGSNKVRSGAGYYGIMELSGNVLERTVSIGNTTGRMFNGLHGDGELSPNGNANTDKWPGLANGEVLGSAGSGFRGGSFLLLNSRLRTSDRFNSNYSTTIRYADFGGRGVRTAP